MQSRDNEQTKAFFLATDYVLANGSFNIFRLRLRPRMLVDVSSVSLRTTILGSEIDFPICVAPSSQHMLAHSVGEFGTAKGERLNDEKLPHK